MKPSERKSTALTRRKSISSSGAVVVGPYSHAICAGDLIFISGQTPLDPITGKLVNGAVEEQVTQCMNNLGAILDAAGLNFDDVVKCNVFLTDMNDFATLNKVYARYFREPFPARTTIGVAALPLGARVEIEMIAKVSIEGTDAC